MILTVVLSSVVLMLLAGVAFLFARYLPIIANLFMNITIRRTGHEARLLEGETVRFKTSDGVTLTGTLTPARDGNPDAPVVVFCHEFTLNRHSVTHYGWFLGESGFRVFTFDFRGHGDSDRSAGYQPRQWVTEHEICDLRSALSYLRSRSDLKDSPIALFGVSRGATTAIIVASRDSSVSAVVSDSAFSTRRTLHGYMRRWAPIFVASSMLPLSYPNGIFSMFRYLATKLAEHRLGVRFVPIEPSLRRLTTPVLFLHGECDSYIEKDQAALFHRLTVGDKELWIVPRADHNRAVDVAPTEYSQRVVTFLRTFLGVEEPVVTTVS